MRVHLPVLEFPYQYKNDSAGRRRRPTTAQPPRSMPTANADGSCRRQTPRAERRYRIRGRHRKGVDKARRRVTAPIRTEQPRPRPFAVGMLRDLFLTGRVVGKCAAADSQCTELHRGIYYNDSIKWGGRAMRLFFLPHDRLRAPSRPGCSIGNWLPTRRVVACLQIGAGPQCPPSACSETCAGRRKPRWGCMIDFLDVIARQAGPY